METDNIFHERMKETVKKDEYCGPRFRILSVFLINDVMKEEETVPRELYGTKIKVLSYQKCANNILSEKSVLMRTKHQFLAKNVNFDSCIITGWKPGEGTVVSVI